jgi:2-polyprenyl-3-methyl-5-hydroxy-6-metoxy-1,4-benzoquinol methylase
MSSDSVLRHYDTTDEASRLDSGAGLVEKLRTLELLGRFLPPSPATVLDVGGAAGVYAASLAAQDYRVHLVDLSPKHVEQARAVAAAQSEAFTAEVGDVRALPQDDSSFDAVLLLGPLYHLQEADDRVQAWREAGRVVRPGGVVVGATINRYASLIGGLSNGFLFDDGFAQIVRRAVETGCHENPDEVEHWFTTAYFHHPAEIESEIADAGLHHQATLGIEGAGAFVPPDVEERMADPEARARILEAARIIESEPSLMGLSAHLFVVARRGA